MKVKQKGKRNTAEDENIFYKTLKSTTSGNKTAVP